MLDAELLKSLAAQLMTSASVSVDGKSIPVRPTSRQHLRTAAFRVGGHEYQAIEQNPEKPSRWGQLAKLEAVIRSCNLRTQRVIGSWRLWWMAKLRFTAWVRRDLESPSRRQQHHLCYSKRMGCTAVFSGS